MVSDIRHLRRGLWPLIVALATLTAAGNARATDEASPADKETARALMDMGRKAEADGDWAAAAKAYQGADEIMAVPTTALSLGRAQMQLGQLVAARDAMLRAARFPKADDEPAVFTRARKEALSLAKDLAERIPTLTVELDGLPGGATAIVAIDGERLPPRTLALPRRLDPGRHTVTAGGPGLMEVTRRLTLAEAQSEKLRLTIRPDPNATAPASVTPASAPRHDGAEDDAGSVSPWVWIGLGVGGVGILAGSVTGGLSLAAVGRAKDQCQDDVCPLEAKSHANRGKVLGYISTTSFAVGATGLATALVAGLFFSPEEVESARLTPLVAPDRVGLFLRF